MKAFAELYSALDETTKTGLKTDALVQYFSTVPAEDAVWAIHFLIGRRPKRLIETRKLVDWAIEESGSPAWLFDESYQAVGDLAETIALLLPDAERSTNRPLHYWVEERLLPLARWEDAERKTSLVDAWRDMDDSQRFVWNKLITGAFRVGVSQSLVVRALAQVSGIDGNVIAHRMMGDWSPSPDFYSQLIAKESADADISRPYPFFLAYPIEGAIDQLGDIAEWQIEWKWDGIRSQLVRRKFRTFIWSRGEELVTERFPELEALGSVLPEGTVIDGEILPWKDGAPLPFAQMQRRIGRKVLGPKILADVPVVILAYDLLEWRGEDIRERPIEERRRLLGELVEATRDSNRLLLSDVVPAASWEELIALRAQSRERKVEGFMLKRHGSPLSGGQAARRLVEVENRAVFGGCGDVIRAARERAAGQPVHGLHVRRLGFRYVGAVREGLFRADGRRDSQSGCLGAPEHIGEIRTSSFRKTGIGVRTRIRRHSVEHPA